MKYFFTYSPDEDDGTHLVPEEFFKKIFDDDLIEDLILFVVVENFFDDIHPHVHGIMWSGKRQDKLRESIYRKLGFTLEDMKLNRYRKLFKCSVIRSEEAVDIYHFQNMEQGGTILWDRCGFTERYSKWKEHTLRKISKFDLLTRLEKALKKDDDNPEFELSRRDFVRLLDQLIKEGYDVLAHQYQMPQIYNTIKSRLGGRINDGDIFKILY